MSNVVIFNTTPLGVSLSLNGTPISAMAGATGPAWTATAQTIARDPGTVTGTNPKFAQQNKLTVTFQGNSVTYPVNLSPFQVPDTNDVQLYIFFTQIVVSNQGLVLPQPPPSAPMAAEGY